MPGDNITVGQSGIVYVLGDVERPGGFLLDRRSSLSVIQALALAEGAKNSATLSKARLIRSVAEQRQEIPLNLKMILQSKSPDVVLQPGDIVFVPGSLTRGMGRRAIDTILATAGGVAIYSRF
jgi:polysaccharide export outer membrane protein